MFPWLWLWAPTFHLPWSGAVSQRIDPSTDWFFGSIPPQAGDGALEKQAFDIASYGRQLGWLTELALAGDPQAGVPPEQAERARTRLRNTRRAIEAMKTRNKDRLREDAEAALRRLAEADPAAHDALLAARAPRRLPSKKASS